MQTIEVDEYRVSDRVVLRPGDQFTVAGGPYWRGSDGARIPMAARGRFSFTRAIHYGKRVYLVAVNRDGVAILHVEGRRKNKLAPEIVCRPYRIRAKHRAVRSRHGLRER